MKQLKDYLHLYLGCECVYKNVRLQLLQTDKVNCDLYDYRINEKYHTSLKLVKPILRPLSDMTEEECEFFYHWHFGKRSAEDWSGDTGSSFFKPKKVAPTFAHIKRIIDGEDYASDGFMKTVELTKWLLDLNFDLFGLIEAGLAIDKTKT